MHLLPCPFCQKPIPVAPSQAGEEAICPGCNKKVDIPKLGQLRQLPRQDSDGGARVASNRNDADAFSLAQVAFVLCGLIATASLLILGFCTIRWALIEVPMTTQGHIEFERERLTTLNPAELIREFEQMEDFSLDVPGAFNYQTIADEKYGWGRNAVVAGAVAGVALLGAILFGFGRRNRYPATDT